MNNTHARVSRRGGKLSLNSRRSVVAVSRYMHRRPIPIHIGCRVGIDEQRVGLLKQNIISYFMGRLRERVHNKIYNTKSWAKKKKKYETKRERTSGTTAINGRDGRRARGERKGKSSGQWRRAGNRPFSRSGGRAPLENERGFVGGHR